MFAPAPILAGLHRNRSSVCGRNPKIVQTGMLDVARRFTAFPVPGSDQSLTEWTSVGHCGGRTAKEALPTRIDPSAAGSHPRPVRDLESLRKFLESRIPGALDLLRQMVEINSFTGNRAGVNRLGRFTADCFAPLGFSAEFIPSVNPDYGDHLVLSRPGRSSRSLAMISHLDTVFPIEEEQRNNFRWRPDGERIYGPGTHDIKGGTIMIWLVLAALREVDPVLFEEVGWTLCLNSSEETLAQDFGEICRKRFEPRPAAALVFEAEGRLGEEALVVVSRKGRASWRVTVSGRGSHAGAKHSHGANAVVQAGRLVEKIAQMTDYSRDLTFNVARIEGGTVLNRVPHEAVIEGEFRAFSSEEYERAKSALLALEGEGDVRSPVDRHACRVRVEITTESRPWPRNQATDRLAEIWREAGKEAGVPVNIERRGGLSDGNLLWDLLPTLDGLGPWGDNDHCSEWSADGSKVPEYVYVPSILPKAVLNACAIRKLMAAVS